MRHVAIFSAPLPLPKLSVFRLADGRFLWLTRDKEAVFRLFMASLDGRSQAKLAFLQRRDPLPRSGSAHVLYSA